MLKYTDYHFKTEEELFDKYDYPKSGEHKVIHNDFFEKTNYYKAKYEEGEENIHYDLMKYLKDWLLAHIQGEDVKYVDFFKENGIEI